jgi:SAM-dependent methyltransferase
MSINPVTWHHGLIARVWGEKIQDPTKEKHFFDRIIASSGEPMLDVGCGSGRLLIPWLHDGLDIDGCDVAPDMLDQCRLRAEREGFEPRLYCQATHEIDLPRVYRTIVMCGAIGLGGDRHRDMEGLRRCYRHLEKGGVLVLDSDVPWASEEDWLEWRSGQTQSDAWPPPAAPEHRDPFEDGTQFEMYARTVRVDPLTQVSRLEMRVRHYVEGTLAAEEVHPILIRTYLPAELVAMLEDIGYERIETFGDYSESPASAGDNVHVFVAHKGG